jgi:7,8-dihydroneopterin aldolase/epimerase/oxygenase
MDRITLRGMRFEGRIGATEEERALPQLLEVDLVVEADLSAAAASDTLADGVDYAPLVELTRQRVEGSVHHLLESLAGALAAATLETSPAIAAITVRVRKLAVPMDVWMEHAEVEIRRTRDGDAGSDRNEA